MNEQNQSVQMFQTNQTPIPIRPSALTAMASRFNMEPATLMNTLKNTVFKGATNEQLAALVIVANEHGLNPFTREIYAFPDKSGGIQAVIGVDGWIRIITTNPSFNGVEFSSDAQTCTCIMHVKGREYPVKVTEYLDECKRNTEPWRTYPRRMLRHKALIQAGRIAFGLGSLKDEDDVVIAPSSVTVTRPIFVTPTPQIVDEPPTTTATAQDATSGESDDIPMGNSPQVALTIQQDLAHFMGEAGVKFDDLRDFLATKLLLKDAASVSDYDSLPAAVCEKLKNAPKTMAELIRKFGRVQGKEDAK